MIAEDWDPLRAPAAIVSVTSAEGLPLTCVVKASRDNNRASIAFEGESLFFDGWFDQRSSTFRPLHPEDPEWMRAQQLLGGRFREVVDSWSVEMARLR